MSYFPSNSKFKQGDEVLLIDYHANKSTARAVVLSWRGGGVAPYFIEVIEDYGGYEKTGSRYYKAGRDMKLFKREVREVRKYLSVEEKLDLLLEHLGLTIEIEPRVISADGEKESNQE